MERRGGLESAIIFVSVRAPLQNASNVLHSQRKTWISTGMRIRVDSPIFLGSLLIQVAISLIPLASFADTSVDVCVGFDAERRNWGPAGNSDSADGVCPHNHAFLGANPARPVSVANVALSPVYGVCCPLPAGVLLEQHVIAEVICPKNHVVSGTVHASGERSGKRTSSSDTHLLRCTAIDTSRYSLGPASEGARLELASSLWDDLREMFANRGASPAKRIRWSKVPVAIRSAFGRVTRFAWLWEICLGDPPGALLIGRSGRFCSGMTFRELRTVPSPAGVKPVRIFPDCRAIDDIFSEEARCVP